jgi:hypothetical protein
MRSHWTRVAIVATLLSSGGFVMLTSPGLGCEAYAAESLLQAVDFCFIFDCTNGVLGGTVKPCQPGLGFNGEETSGLLLDCPDDTEE